MKTLELSKKKTKPTFGLAFPSLSTEHGNFEYDEVEFNSCVEEESPAWHEAVLKEREEEWKNPKVLRGCLENAKMAHYGVAAMLAFVEYYLYTSRLCFSLLVLHQFYLFLRHPLSRDFKEVFRDLRAKARAKKQ